jgi:uncharacterized protein (TIGR03067 family)
MHRSLGILLVTALAATASADDAKNEAIEKYHKAIEGTWRVISLEVNGVKVSDEDVKKMTIVNGSDGTWAFRTDGQDTLKGTSSVDPTKDPRQIELTPDEGENKGQQYVGIYELTENTRKLCVAPPGRDRPTQFTSNPGTDHVLIVLEREKSK